MLNFEILLLSLFLIIFILLILFDFDFFEPCILINAAMFMSVLLAYLNKERWGYNISEVTIFAVLLGYVSFAFGSIFVYKKLFKDNSGQNNKIFKVNFEQNNWLWVTSCLIVAMLSYFSFREVYDLSLRLGNTKGIFGMISTVRYALERHEIDFPSRFMTYRFLLGQVIAYSYSYLLVFKFYLNETKLSDVKYIIPPILFFPLLVFTTGRIAIANFLIFVFMITVILYKRKHGLNLKNNLKIDLFLVFFVMFFVSTFFLMGHFTGKVISAQRTPLVILGHYAGLSVPALDRLLTSGYVEDLYIGSTTLINIYRVIEKFGIVLPKVQIFLPFVYFNNIDTNVYTAIGRYIIDYGYLGMSIIMSLMGMLYTYFYHRCLQSSGKFMIILYSTFCFPLFLSSIDDRFLLDIVGMPFVYLFSLFYLAKIVLLNRYFLCVETKR